MQQTANRQRTPEGPPGSPCAGSPGAAGRWARFLIGALLIPLIAFGVIPAVQRLGPVREVREATRTMGVDADALIYSESDVSLEAETSLRDALRFSAADPAADAADSIRGRRR